MPAPPFSRLFLVGYRGSGKSTVARLVAQRLGWSAVDADDEVEAAAGRSIAAIFADSGERAFRDLEQSVTAVLCDREQAVISLGGGAVLRDATRERVRDAGPVVWLTASPETLAERIEADPSTATRRPGLTVYSGIDEVRRILAEREPLYAECATLTVDGEGRSPAEVADEVVARLAVTPS